MIQSPTLRQCFIHLAIMSMLFVVSAQAGPEVEVETLLVTDQTVLGQSFEYPPGNPEITSTVITIPPGSVLSKHFHSVPLFAYMLQGELIVNYGDEGERTFRKGDAFMEVIGSVHQGRNGSKGVVKILVVYMGSDEAPNTVIE